MKPQALRHQIGLEGISSYAESNALVVENRNHKTIKITEPVQSIFSSLSFVYCVSGTELVIYSFATEAQIQRYQVEPEMKILFADDETVVLLSRLDHIETRRPSKIAE